MNKGLSTLALGFKTSLGVDTVHILKVGLTHETASIELREKLSFSEDMLGKAMVVLNEQKSILENVIVSTCNRMEVYAVVDQVHTGRYYITQFLADWFNIEKGQFEQHLEILENDQVIEHLFKVSVGLDSMVLGETQILGQIREAFFMAQAYETTGTIFNELFKQTITFSKRAHRETAISEQAVSISYAAVELAKKIFGDIHDKRLLILGAGEMGEQTAKNLYGAGATDMVVINRTLERAEELAGKFQAEAKDMSDLVEELKDADILISSTGSPDVVLTSEDLAPVQKYRKGNPLFLVDIALPRDLDPSIEKLDSVFLYDIDDLQHVVDENLQSRKEAAEIIEAMLAEEVYVFKEWIATLGVVPVISALREKALSIQEETLASIFRKIPDLTDREQKVLNKHTKSIINQMLKAPIKQAKELAAKENPEAALELLVDVFGLDENIKEEVRNEIKRNKTLAKVKKHKKSKVSFPMIENFISN